MGCVFALQRLLHPASQLPRKSRPPSPCPTPSRESCSRIRSARPQIPSSSSSTSIPRTTPTKSSRSLAVISEQKGTSTKQAFGKQLSDLNRSSESLFEQNRAYYRDLLNTEMHLETPDKRLDLAFSRAESSIDQLRVETTPGHHEEALTAGFVGSGASVRPGFGWYFGRDALWTTYALNSSGNFETTRQEVEFLLKRQSPEGKIMHEWAQTADLVDWKSLPYEYASADATPLLRNGHERLSPHQRRQSLRANSLGRPRSRMAF